MTHVQRTTLADGRELFYFDDAPGADRGAVDARALDPVAGSPQTRWDPLYREWAVLADHRQSRTYRPPTGECPLDPSRPGRPTEIPAADYDVVVFENRFPSLSEHATPPVEVSGDPLLRADPGVGRCEVVCFTSDHDLSFADLPPRRVRTVIDALAERTAALGRIPGVEYVFCFENRGEEIGVTLSHPHGQIYAYPFVPPRMHRAAQAARDYASAHGGRCLRCAMLDSERAAGIRIVEQGEYFTVHVPFAARWPYEVSLVPHRHVPGIDALSSAERDELARLYPATLRRFDALFASPAPYIACWHQAPVHRDQESWHLTLQVFSIRRAADKLKALAGSESGAAVWINDIAPERAAAALRGEVTRDRWT
jgi:UDPglucose--hexose-1-phosphate uridylyltransferase